MTFLSSICSLLDGFPQYSSELRDKNGIYNIRKVSWQSFADLLTKYQSWFEQFEKDVEEEASKYVCVERKKLSELIETVKEEIEVSKIYHAEDVADFIDRVEELLQPSGEGSK